MPYKSIEKIFDAPASHWVGDGLKVHNFIPSVIPMDRISPFVMLDYGATNYIQPSEIPKGVGVHPHRGFETVTVVYKGVLAHHDSRGNSGIIGPGEVQWMTASSGILHKEYHEKEFSKTGGNLQFVQLWVNLPAKDKMSDPKYQALDKDKIVQIELPNSFGKIELIAGEILGKTGPAFTFTPITLFSLYLEQGGEFGFEISANFNNSILVLEGEIEINNLKIKENQMALMQNDGNQIQIKASKKSVILIMAGEPINEPIASYGPFLMNTKAEIYQAMEDFQNGKFGELE